MGRREHIPTGVTDAKGQAFALWGMGSWVPLLGMCVATAQRKEDVCLLLAVLFEEVEKDSIPLVPTKGMADHAHPFRD